MCAEWQLVMKCIKLINIVVNNINRVTSLMSYLSCSALHPIGLLVQLNIVGIPFWRSGCQLEYCWCTGLVLSGLPPAPVWPLAYHLRALASSVKLPPIFWLPSIIVYPWRTGLCQRVPLVQYQLCWKFVGRWYNRFNQDDEIVVLFGTCH